MSNRMSRYELKITLDCNKKIYRVLRICGSDTLNNLSNIILSSFDFNDEHLYLFNLDNVKYSDNAYYCMPEYGDQSADIPIDQLQLAENQKILYLYDFGDEWVFRILVQKIECEENYSKPVVVKSIGEIEQYHDYEEALLECTDKIKVIDILEEIEDELIQDEYLSLFDYKSPIDEKNISNLRNKIAEEVLNHPEHFALFLQDIQLKHLVALTNNENVFSDLDRCELMKLYCFGFCKIDDDYGFTIKVPKEVITVYKSYLEDGKNKKAIAKNSEVQKIMEYLISKYGVIELNDFYQIICFITKINMEYVNFEYFLGSRLHYFGEHNIFELDDRKYISLFEERETLKILEQRNSTDEYRKLSYPVFTLQHCRKAIEQNYYMEYVDYKKWWEYLNFDCCFSIQTYNKLLAITTYAALMESKDEKKILRECRNLFHQEGRNFTRKAERLIKSLMNGMPSAIEKGRTFDEYGKIGLIRHGMYNSIEEAIQDSRKKPNVKERYNQLSLFDES